MPGPVYQDSVCLIAVSTWSLRLGRGLDLILAPRARGTGARLGVVWAPGTGMPCASIRQCLRRNLGQKTWREALQRDVVAEPTAMLSVGEQC